MDKNEVIEKEIYWACYERPMSIYDLIVKLETKGFKVGYSSCCQKCGILCAKGRIERIKVNNKNMFKAREIPPDFQMQTPTK